MSPIPPDRSISGNFQKFWRLLGSSIEIANINRRLFKPKSSCKVNVSKAELENFESDLKIFKSKLVLNVGVFHPIPNISISQELCGQIEAYAHDYDAKVVTEVCLLSKQLDLTFSNDCNSKLKDLEQLSSLAEPIDVFYRKKASKDEIKNFRSQIRGSAMSVDQFEVSSSAVYENLMTSEVNFSLKESEGVDLLNQLSKDEISLEPGVLHDEAERQLRESNFENAKAEFLANLLSDSRKQMKADNEESFSNLLNSEADLKSNLRSHDSYYVLNNMNVDNCCFHESVDAKLDESVCNLYKSNDVIAETYKAVDNVKKMHDLEAKLVDAHSGSGNVNDNVNNCANKVGSDVLFDCDNSVHNLCNVDVENNVNVNNKSFAAAISQS